MAHLTNKDYFYGQRQIPQVTEGSVLEELNAYIDSLEPKVLTCLLGSTMYVEFQAAYDASVIVAAPPMAQKWLDLVNGKTYVDKYGNNQVWFGLRSDTMKVGLIANYIYFYWARGHASFSTGSGEKNIASENATPSYPMFKQNDAWREMVQWNKELRLFLQSNTDVYDTWNDPLTPPVYGCHCKDLFRTNNNLNL